MLAIIALWLVASIPAGLLFAAFFRACANVAEDCERFDHQPREDAAEERGEGLGGVSIHNDSFLSSGVQRNHG